MRTKWALFCPMFLITTTFFTAECARMKLSAPVAHSICEQLEIFRRENVIPSPVMDHRLTDDFPRGHVLIPSEYENQILTLEPEQYDRSLGGDSGPAQKDDELKCHSCDVWEGESPAEEIKFCAQQPTTSKKTKCPLHENGRPICQFTYYARARGHPARGVKRRCADTQHPGYTLNGCFFYENQFEEYVMCWCQNSTGIHCNHCADIRVNATDPPPDPNSLWTYPTEADGNVFNFEYCPRLPKPPKPPPTISTTTTTTIRPPVTPEPPGPPPTPSPGACKCHVCESILGKPKTYACKDKPKSTAVRTCKVGEGCRTLASYSSTLKTWVLRRGCTPLRDVGSKCTAYPPFAPPLCTDCKTPSCECVCKKDYCNDFVYPDEGWDVCGNKQPCPGETTTETPPGPPTEIECHTCVSYENDPTTWACKDKPETTPLVKCALDEHCQTITYLSKKTGGSALMRGCVKREDVTNACRRNRPIPPETKETLQCDSCKDPSCECLCDTDKCNNEVFEGDGWKAC